MVVGDMRSVFPLGKLVFLTGSQGVKDQSSQQVLVLPISELKLGLRAWSPEVSLSSERSMHMGGWGKASTGLAWFPAGALLQSSCITGSVGPGRGLPCRKTT